MTDRHASRPNDEQWRSILDECGALVDALLRSSSEARRRTKDNLDPGYPPGIGYSDVHGGAGRHDFVGDIAAALADGDVRPDKISTSVNRMTSTVLDARSRLLEAVAAMRSALPVQIADPVAEVCVDCGTNKRVAKRWHPETSRCGTCQQRLNRSA